MLGMLLVSALAGSPWAIARRRRWPPISAHAA